MIKYMLEENLKRGEQEFPVGLYEIQLPSGPILPCHWHEDFEMIHMKEGSADFRVGNEAFCVRAGESLFVNSGEIHSGNSIDPLGCNYYAIVFSLSFLNSLLSDSCQRFILSLSLKNTCLVHKPDISENSDEINKIVEEIIAAISFRETGYELFVKSSLFMLLSVFQRYGLIINTVYASESSRSHEIRIKKVIDYITRHYHDHICLDELSSLVNMSRYNFCRFFKEHTGVTPFEYINLYRINAAYILLQEGDCNVTDAAIQSGFDNMSYFARTFKKYKNVAPSSVKKAKCEVFI
jgi:AraC-like DNA-binding protein